MVPAVVFIVGGLEEETKEKKEEARECARCTRSSITRLKIKKQNKRQETLYPVRSEPGIPRNKT